MNPAASSSISGSEARTARARAARFFTGLALPLFLLLAVFGACSLVLERSGEYLSLDAIIARQKETGGLYGSALFQRAFHYKLALHAHVRPDIVALGSSRALQFRRADFSSSFVNLGSMSDLDELSELAHSAFSVHKPQLVILGADFWWFHPQAEKAFVNRSPAEVSPALKDFIELLGWIAGGKISFGDIREILGGKTPHTGIAAITRGDGYSADGSYHYTSTLTGAAPPDDPRFAESLAKIEEGSKIYAHGDSISQAQWKKFQELLIFLASEKIEVVLFLPPLAPAVARAMEESGKYKYVSDLRWMLGKMAKERGIAYSDFHDASVLGAGDCEFIDGHHGGPVVYQRILLHMAVAHEGLRKRAKLPETALSIRTFGGRASLLAGETDFLGLGCEKK